MVRRTTICILLILLGIHLFAGEIADPKEIKEQIDKLRYAVARLTIQLINVLEGARREGISVEFRMQIEDIITELSEILDILKVELKE